DIQVTSVSSSDNTVTVVITGNGFVEDSNSEYRFGIGANGLVLLDAGANTGPDVQNRFVSGIGTIANGQVTLTIPLSDGVFGPISVKTDGGLSASYSVSLTSIESVAYSGTPADPSQASANPGQSILLHGTGLSTSTSVLLRYTDYSGLSTIVEVN